LLATDSLGIEKVQEHGFFGLPSGFLGLSQIIQPTDIQSHNHCLLFETGLTPLP
jgi:hypothetical protein